jgi:hypothetical protein
MHESCAACLEHAASHYGVNVMELKEQFKLDQYGCIQLINYLRSTKVATSPRAQLRRVETHRALELQRIRAQTRGLPTRAILQAIPCQRSSVELRLKLQICSLTLHVASSCSAVDYCPEEWSDDEVGAGDAAPTDGAAASQPSYEELADRCQWLLQQLQEACV